MGVFDSLSQTSHKAVDVGEEYVLKTQEYYKLKVFQQLTSTIGVFCKLAIMGGLLLLGITLLAVAGTIALGQLIGNMVFACLIIALFLFVLVGLIYRFRARIDTMIIQKTAKHYFD